jgi:bleomycin hydrolase
MKKAYTIISNLYGVPKEKFDFEYTDKQGNYHIEQGITPKEFYKKYIDIDLLNDYIEIVSYEDEKLKYNKMYQENDSSRMSGVEDVITPNITPKEFNELILKQLKQNIPVYFHCSTTIKCIDGVYIDTLQRYGEIFDIDLELDNNSVLKTNGITGCHAMIITGANVVNGKITRYKIEDNYGNCEGKNGYWAATKDWAEKYINRIVINKKLLTKKQQEILKQKPIKIESWDCKF